MIRWDTIMAIGGFLFLLSAEPMKKYSIPLNPSLIFIHCVLNSENAPPSQIRLICRKIAVNVQQILSLKK